MPGQGRNLGIGLHPFRNFAPTIRRDGVKEQWQQIGPLFQHPVVDCLRAHKKAVASVPGFAQAKKPHDIRTVCMKGLPRTGLVDPAVRVIRICSKIAHVTENMPLRVLRTRLAQMRADPAENRCGKALIVVSDRKAPDHLEAAAMQEGFLKLRKVPG